MIKFGKASNLLPTDSFALLIVLVIFFHEEKQLEEERRRRRNSDRIFYGWGEKMNHFWVKRKLWSIIFLSQSLLTLQLYQKTELHLERIYEKVKD